MNSIFKSIIKGICVFLILILSFILLLSFSYILPNNRIRNHLSESIGVFKIENGSYYKPFFGLDRSEENNIRDVHTLDDYTDTLILAIAWDKGENQGYPLLDRVVSNYRFEKSDEGPVDSFKEIENENNEANSTYTRYWFGIEAFLRPLLLFFNYQEIRYLNIIFLMMLFIISILMINKKIGTKYAIAYCFSIILMGFIIIPLSLQYIPVMIITLVSTIILLMLKDNKNIEKIAPYLFLCIGAITAFMDLLTYPLVTFGIPIIILILIKNKNEEIKNEKGNIKDYIILLFKLGILWAMGYGATYFIKWVIASAILHKNIVSEAINQFLYRADLNTDKRFSKTEVLLRNFNIYFNRYVLGILIMYLIIWGIFMIKCKKNKMNKSVLIILLAVSIIPYIWYILLSNHSAIHAFMTYRIQGVTMFALLAGTLYMLDDKKIINKNGGKK